MFELAGRGMLSVAVLALIALGAQKYRLQKKDAKSVVQEVQKSPEDGKKVMIDMIAEQFKKLEVRSESAVTDILPTIFPVAVSSVLQQNSADKWSPEEDDENAMVDGNQNILWKNVRSEDQTNCGYHALKNIVNWLLSQSHYSQDSQTLVLWLSQWVPVIYKARADELTQYLKLSPEQKLTDFLLQAKRSSIKDDLLKSYINSNDGHVKTEMLGDVEVQLLINTLQEELRDNIIVLSDQAVNFVKNEEIFQENQPFLSDAEKNIVIRAQDRLRQFCRAISDRLGIVWTEAGFNHWVAFGLEKKDGNITVIYMNSIETRHPNKVKPLFEYLENTCK